MARHLLHGFTVPMSQTRAFLSLRYTLIVATAYLVLVEQDFALPSIAPLLLVVAALATNVAIAFLPERSATSVRFGVVVIIYDTAWITATLILSGRFSVEFFYLYFFVLLLAAIGENLLLIAVGAFALCGAYLYGHVATGGTWSLWHSPSLIRIPFLFATAIFYGYLVDRTRSQRRRAEQSEELARQLSRTLAELRVLYSQAQEADRIKTEFLATVSHELRTPLVAVLGYIELVLDRTFGPLHPQQAEVLEQAQNAGRTLHQVITQVLDASRIEMGREQLTCETFDVNQLLAELRNEFRNTDWVTLRYPDVVEMPPLHTDVAKVRTILRNLVDNAVKYTPHGTVSLAVRWDRSRDQVEVRVSDTGTGIAPDQLPYIFEAFRRGGDHDHNGAPGVGLGLYIVRRLVASIGGEVTVESQPGTGSTFSVRFARDISAGAPQVA
ncbi:MAG TPA: HAMP domain-containing sensor histidine kinase [Candidatus Kryptonia bacterium]|nr:HAMP domain-containing sensor histidine kinase [Candidatus Kryptonia bacterium]